MAGFHAAEFWTAADGARLALRRCPARGRTRAVLILLHGFGDHSGRYGDVAAWFAERGVSVYAFDQRGHGRSPGPRGHIARFAQYLSDVVALRRLAATEQPGPQVLLGHSHGGLVALRYVEAAPQGVSGVILSSPFIAIGMVVPRWKLALGRILPDVAPKLPVPTGLDFAHLSTDPAVGQAARSDPLYHRVMSPRAFRETVDAQAALLGERERIGVPLLFLLAGGDRIASTGAAERFAVSLTGDVTLRVFDGFFHEVLNEPDRRRVYGEIEPWLDRVLAAPLPAAAPAPRES